MTIESTRHYIRYYVVRIDVAGLLEPVHPGALPFYSDAVRLVEEWRRTGHRLPLAIIDEATWDAHENDRAQSIHECQTERVLCQDERGTYWRCPQCDGVCPDRTVGP